MSARRRVVLAALTDVLAVLLFVTVGRRNHDEGDGVLDVFGTAAPFWGGLLIGWMAWRAWRDPLSLATGLRVWSVGVVCGLAIRAPIEGELPVSFAIVATLVLGFLLLGWRGVAARIAIRRNVALPRR